jgi:hypothetical protein
MNEHRGDPLSSDDWNRIARRLWGDEALEGGHFYPSSSDEVVAVLNERIRELAARPCGGTVQDLQLELIRRSSYNAFDGPRVLEDLLQRRASWEAVLFDRLGVGVDLIKLRDLADDCWNVDTLYVLAKDERSARELAELEEPWAADVVMVHDAAHTARALGRSPMGSERLVTFWWD